MSIWVRETLENISRLRGALYAIRHHSKFPENFETTLLLLASIEDIVRDGEVKGERIALLVKLKEMDA